MAGIQEVFPWWWPLIGDTKSPAPAPAPAPAPPSIPPQTVPTITGIDPNSLVNTLYDKSIPLVAGSRYRIGGRIIEGPIGRVISGENCVSMIVGFCIPANYYSDTRTITAFSFNGIKAWTLAGGALMSGVAFDTATVGDAATVRWTTGTLDQAADAWSISKFGSSANAYRPMIFATIENVGMAQFPRGIPFCSVDVADTAFGDPDDECAWADLLNAVAVYDGRVVTGVNDDDGIPNFECVDVTGTQRAVILGDKINLIEWLQSERKNKPHWNLLTKDQLYVVEKASTTVDVEIDLEKVLRNDTRSIEFHHADSFDRARKLTYTYVDYDRDFELNTVEAGEDRDPVPSTDSYSTDSYVLGNVTTVDNAIADVNYAYYAGELAKETGELTGTTHYYAIDPGDVLQIPTDFGDFYHRVTESVRKVDFTIDLKTEGVLTCLVAGTFGHRYWRIHVTSNLAAAASRARIATLTFQNVEGSNLSTGGTAVSDVDDGVHLAANAFDGSGVTYYDTGIGSQADYGLGYQFTFPVTIERVLVKSFDPQNPFTSMDVQRSDDGTTWTTVWSESDEPDYYSGQTRWYINPTLQAAGDRYFRIYVTADNAGTIAARIREIQFRRTAGVAEHHINDGGWAAASSTGGSGDPYQAFDSDVAYHQNAVFFYPFYLYYKFPEGRTIAQVSITVDDTSLSPRDFLIQSSSDNAAWTTLKTVTGATWTTGQTRTYSIP